jgi:hypothetical protein
MNISTENNQASPLFPLSISAFSCYLCRKHEILFSIFFYFQSFSSTPIELFKGCLHKLAKDVIRKGRNAPEGIETIFVKENPSTVFLEKKRKEKKQDVH